MLIISLSDRMSSTNIPFSLKSVDTTCILKGPILVGKLIFAGLSFRIYSNLT